MEAHFEIIKQQYEEVRGARQVVLNCCMAISPEDLIYENSSFGRGSIRNLLVHIAHVCEFGLPKTHLTEW